jgi:hypothetical protein
MSESEPHASKAEIDRARKALQRAETDYRAAVKEAATALARAQRDREAALKRAREAVDEAEAHHRRRISTAAHDVNAAIKGQLLASYGPVNLYDDRLEAPDGSVPLDGAIRASVEVQGQKTEKFDTREVTLLLDTPRFDSVIRCNPNDATPVREFAARINTAAKNADAHLRTHRERFASAKQALENAKADRKDAEDAAKFLTAVEADTAAVDAAERAHKGAQANTGRIEAARQHLLSLDPHAKIKDVKAPTATLAESSVGLWWNDRSKIGKVLLIAGSSVLALIVLAIVISVVGGDDKTADQREAPNPPPTTIQDDRAAPTKPDVVLSIVKPKLSRTIVYGKRFSIRGFVTPGSKVRINRARVRVRGNRFSATLPLKLGDNAFVISAHKAGLELTFRSVNIARRLPPLKLVVLNPASRTTTVRQPSYTLTGRTTPGARVTVRGTEASLSGATFTLNVPLQQGRNVLGVRADKAGFASRYTRVTIIRRLSREEIAQKQEERRQAFINSATTIPYNQLIKNPDAYAGTRVKYYGEILQIQEEFGRGFMLLYVTDLGYDIWSDQVWVNYDGHVRGAQGDKLTIYGTVVGTKSYETQIGGETYVPEIDAIYIVE